MKTSTPLVLLSIVILMACGTGSEHLPAPVVPSVEKPVDPMAKYRRLCGAWMDSTTSGRFTSYERWSVLNDSALVGFGFVLAKGDTVFVEDLKLEVVDGGVAYSARMDSQNGGAWVTFAAQETGPDSLIFENPGHDFPQCITYVMSPSGAWDVLVSGTEDGAERSERSLLRPHTRQAVL